MIYCLLYKTILTTGSFAFSRIFTFMKYSGTLICAHPALSYKNNMATISDKYPCITLFDLPLEEAIPLVRPDFSIWGP